MTVRDGLKLEARAAQADQSLKARAAGAAAIEPRDTPISVGMGAAYGQAVAFNHALDRVRIFAAGTEVSDKVHGGYLTKETIEADLKLLGL